MKTIKVRRGWYKVPNTQWFVVHDDTIVGDCKWAVQSENHNDVLRFCEEWDQLYSTKREAMKRLKDFING